MPTTRRSRRRNLRTALASPRASYLLRDQFNTTIAAGSLVNRYSEPGPGQIIAVTDATSAIEIANGALVFGGAGSNDYTQSRVCFTSQVRVAGKVLLFDCTPAGVAGFCAVGWGGANPPVASGFMGPRFSSSSEIRDLFITGADAKIGTYTAALQQLAVVLRSTGHVILQKVSGRWIVLHINNSVTTTPVYPAVIRFANAHTVDNLRVLGNLWQTPVLASDSFDRANGALGSTDGAGTEEPGGANVAWATLQGTCAVASNKAAFSARDGISGIGLATVDCGVADGIWEATITTGAAAGGRPGIAFRVTDANNYWRAYVDNSANLLRIDQVVAGSVTNRASVAATVADSTSYRLLVIADGASIQAFFNNATRAAYASAAVHLTSTKCGLWVDTDVDVAFDGFSAKPRYVPTFHDLADAA